MSEWRRHVTTGGLLLSILSFFLVFFSAGPRAAQAQPQNLFSLTLREYGLSFRDGTMQLYLYPGSPFPGNLNLGSSFNVTGVCSPNPPFGGVYLAGGNGMGDLLALTAGWPFPPGNLCDPGADLTAWFPYGSSLNALSPGQVPPRFGGTNFPYDIPACTTTSTAVEGMFFVGLRSTDRQGPDASCTARDPNFPILVGNVLFCELSNPPGTWLPFNPGAVGFRSCEFYQACSNQTVGSPVPRGTCGNVAGAIFNPALFGGVAGGIGGIGGGGTGGRGSVTVLVNNAVDGNPIQGASVTMVSGPTQTTAADGTTTFTFVPVGLFPIPFTASAPGFVPAQSAITPVENTSQQLTISLTPPVSGGRIVLNWGADPRDLDSHLTGPDGTGGRFHVYFANRTGPGVNLDHDDVDGFGPETITVNQIFPGVYRYSVHQFAGNSDICTMSGQISVSITVGAQQLAPIHPPATGCVDGVDNVWVVFEFDGVNLTFPNTFYSSFSGDVLVATPLGNLDKDVVSSTMPAK